MSFQVDISGFYGPYGGAFIPELLYPNVEELRSNYIDIIGSSDFQSEFKRMLSDYVGRPTPLYHATRLSEKYGASIFLKREDLCHSGAHKINNSLGQIILAEKLGKKRIIAETGAGQHGVATATVCAMKGIECIVYMGAKDIERQAPNVSRMRMLGAEVVPVHSGSSTLKDATNEAIRDWINHVEDTHYIIGSVVGPHPYPDLVAKLQSVISEEMLLQMPEDPTHVVACVGGGSNAIGAFYHYLDKPHVKLLGIEAAGLGEDTDKTAATLSLGTEGILHASKTYVMQDDDGQVIEPHSISAGLDYPGIGPIHAHLKDLGRVAYSSVTDQQAVEAAFELTRLEGIIPALESAHAFAHLPFMDLNETDRVVINLSGRGDKDLATYDKFVDEIAKRG
jgi:tryptophan synthase beta chain